MHFKSGLLSSIQYQALRCRQCDMYNMLSASHETKRLCVNVKEQEREKWLMSIVNPLSASW